ncbi:cyclic lactone autoinducer peptide [Aneurinibacillus thermoaerophilus]|uniref:Cyclic lactone autoinducer peptide n=1 Tax=Aneurinibacillus thermoaerophilus TaxID=143495 RepID=A0ABX8YBR3_ANETH|nr:MULTISPECIES: cyclic lactone autoinducer peptide [Aneurinibacillus]MED0680705.1 cyclic lactone autoinducer peptide [Aneurinibacillus thermoaerophilus]MED0764060.1 cyclic lactone autoinducer peptide [Aneurinibacillus thermoaerophilus]QYY43148.1 cyclic lactone autoinducer peptide [Aneurinibacillus thermoaerophilus]
MMRKALYSVAAFFTGLATLMVTSMCMLMVYAPEAPEELR